MWVLRLQNAQGSGGGCRPVCSDTDRDLTTCLVEPVESHMKMQNLGDGCFDMICLYNNCAASIKSKSVKIVKESTCTFSTVSRKGR